jgi:general secretion pathway protein K
MNPPRIFPARRLGHPAQARVQAVLARRRAMKGKRGVALIMVLSALSVLAVMLTEFQDVTSAELGSSLAARDQIKAEYAALSAVNLARLLIAAEPTVRRDLTPLFMMLRESPKQIAVWAFADAVLGAFNDAEGSAEFTGISGLSLGQTRNLGLNGAGFTLKVIDEDGKLNFNQAAHADTFSQQRAALQIISLIGGIQYNDYFEELDPEGHINDRATVCGAIIDWVDPNTELNVCNPRAEYATQTGAEDSFYRMLKVPDDRKNAAFDSLEELRLVRGIGDDFWTTFVEPDPDRPESRNVTVWGSGAVNVNTANPQTLMATVCAYAEVDTPLCVDPVHQAQFLSTLKLLEGFAAGMPLFSSPQAFLKTLQGQSPAAAFLTAAVGDFQPIKFLSESEFLKVISVETHVLSIYATGYVKSGKLETKVRMHTVVDMRGAPPPGTAEAYAKTQRLLEADGSLLTPDTPQSRNPFLAPSPKGTVIYHRVD